MDASVFSETTLKQLFGIFGIGDRSGWLGGAFFNLGFNCSASQLVTPLRGEGMWLKDCHVATHDLGGFLVSEKRSFAFYA